MKKSKFTQQLKQGFGFDNLVRTLRKMEVQMVRLNPQTKEIAQLAGETGNGHSVGPSSG